MIDKTKNLKDLGFQVSVSKTFNINTEVPWEYLLFDNGISIWLGKFDLENFEIQKPFITNEGVEGKLTVYVPDCHLRFKWIPCNLEKQLTVKLRVTNSKGKARIMFHHTSFSQIEQQEEL